MSFPNPSAVNASRGKCPSSRLVWDVVVQGRACGRMLFQTKTQMRLILHAVSNFLREFHVKVLGFIHPPNTSTCYLFIFFLYIMFAKKNIYIYIYISAIERLHSLATIFSSLTEEK